MRSLLVFFSLLLSFSLWAKYETDLSGWKKNYQKKDLTFYSKKIKNSKLLAFKTVGTLPINMGEMMAALREVEKTQKWDKNIIKKITVDNISDIEAITYSESRIPWPFQNRDMVLTNKLFLDKEKRIFYVDVKSVEHPKFPKKRGLVRARIDMARFIAWPIGKDKTFVEFEVRVDPRGSIPSWLVNMVQKDMPYDFLNGLVKYCHKNDLKPNPGVQKLIDDYFVLVGKKLW